MKHSGPRCILHLSHTDIRSDSRILKEMRAVSIMPNTVVYGLGVENLDEGRQAKDDNIILLEPISLIARRLKYLPSIVRHTLSFIELTFKMLRESRKIAPEIIHSHDVVVLPLAYILKKICNSKLVYDAHELELDRNGISRILSFFTVICERLLWPKIDAFITVSDSILEWYFGKYSQKKLSAVVLNSPSFIPSFGQDQNDYLRQKFSISSQEKVFVYVGICAKGRGIEIILDVFSKLPHYHVVFLGYGPLVEQIIKYESTYSNIHYHLPVEHNLVVEITKSADVGLCFIENVSLSDYYSLPNKLFEYCFSGIPVIASDFPEISKIVVGRNLGVCCSLTSKSLENAIQAIVLNSGKFKIGGDLISDLSWSNQEKRVQRIYSSLFLL